MSFFALASASANEYSNTKEPYDLPLFHELFASEPLLRESFLGSIFGTSTSVTFELESGSSSDYYFLIRDATGTLQAQGKVSNLNTTVQNINGSEMFKIRNTHGTSAHSFDVLYKNVSIGSVKFAEKQPAETCLEIHPRNANSEIVVRSLHFGAFAIYRDETSRNPLCNIHIPYAKVYVEDDFSAAIIFHSETGITTEEQLLCTAAAIAIKVTMKQLLTSQDRSSTFWVYFWGILVVFILIGLGILLFNGLEKWDCESKKERDVAEYADRQC